MTEVKDKKCRNCGKQFKPYRTTDSVCSMQCATEYKNKRETSKKQHQKERQEKSLQQWKELAAMVFNKFIRERDKNEPCICCGKPLGSNYDAGHYFSGAGHAAVLFDEDNVHAQRRECNQGTKSGNFVEYGVRLEQKIGPDQFELLRSRAYEVKRWTPEELQGVAKYYRLKLEKLKKDENNLH